MYTNNHLPLMCGTSKLKGLVCVVQQAYLCGDAPGLLPVKAFLVNEETHELCHSNSRVGVIHLEAGLGGEVLPVLVASLLVPCHHILNRTQVTQVGGQYSIPQTFCTSAASGYRPDSNAASTDLDGGRHKEELLLQTQLLAVFCGIIGVQHRADVLSFALLINCL